MPWFEASSSDSRATGSCTFQISWRAVGPGRGGGLDDGRRHVADAVLDQPDDRRHGEDECRDDGREPRCAEQRHGRQQVDEGGHRLGGVEERPHGGRGALVIGGEDAQRDADDHGQHGRHQHGHQRLMLCSQSPSTAIASRQTAAMMAARQPLMSSATPKMTTIRSHHGAVVRTDSMGLMNP